MPKILFGLAGLVFFSHIAYAAPGAVRCGKLLDVRSGRILSDQVISFDANGRITAVGSAGSTAPESDSTIINLSSATCLPGLIDAHTHLTSNHFTRRLHNGSQCRCQRIRRCGFARWH